MDLILAALLTAMLALNLNARRTSANSTIGILSRVFFALDIVVLLTTAPLIGFGFIGGVFLAGCHVVQILLTTISLILCLLILTAPRAPARPPVPTYIPTYQPPQTQEVVPEEPKKYGAGYTEQPTYQEGGQQYQYPTTQYDQPQSQYPEELPPQQQ